MPRRRRKGRASRSAAFPRSARAIFWRVDSPDRPGTAIAVPSSPPCVDLCRPRTFDDVRESRGRVREMVFVDRGVNLRAIFVSPLSEKDGKSADGFLCESRSPISENVLTFPNNVFLPRFGALVGSSVSVVPWWL